MRAHIIDNGVVINTIIVDSLDVLPGLISADNGGTIGDTWDGSIFAKPVAPIPHTVSPYQARAALDDIGLLDEVETLLTNPATPKKAKLAWLHAQEFRRDSPTVLAMSAQLGLTEEQLDALFIAAAQITA